MTVTTARLESLTTRTDGSCTFVESKQQTDPQILAFQNTVTPLGEEIGGGSQINADGTTSDLSAVKNDSSRQLKVGELKVTTRTGGPIDLRQMDNPEEAVVTLANGMTVGLDQCLRLGLVNVSPDGMVTTRTAAAAPKAAPPIQPVDLGEAWSDLRRTSGGSCDNALMSLMSAVAEGRNLDFHLSQFNEKIGLEATDLKEVKTVYNNITRKIVVGMGDELHRSLPDEVGDKGAEIIEALLEILPASQRVSLMHRVVAGDKGWVKTAIETLRREIRKRS